jgi:hypothetical protein
MTATRRLSVIRDIAAGRRQVWDVMANGWTYSQWVVGNSRTRAVDSNWPEPGASIRHSIGVWPFVLNDKTVVESCVPLEKLVLRARGAPFGAARVTLLLSDVPDGCRVEMIEVPIEGVGRIVPEPVGLLAAYPRNRECLLRLAAIVERFEPSQVD